MARHIKADGTTRVVEPFDGCAFSLEEAQGYVGGWVEMRWLSGGRFMLMNEDGRAKGLPVNYAASALLEATVVGDVLICREDEFE
jgi:hypothetical protein